MYLLQNLNMIGVACCICDNQCVIAAVCVVVICVFIFNYSLTGVALWPRWDPTRQHVPLLLKDPLTSCLLQLYINCPMIILLPCLYALNTICPADGTTGAMSYRYVIIKGRQHPDVIDCQIVRWILIVSHCQIFFIH